MSSLDLAQGSRVFVPLCGKSLDMIWLAQQGHEVIGVELSPVAVEDFFRENGLNPVQRRMVSSPYGMMASSAFYAGITSR